MNDARLMHPRCFKIVGALLMIFSAHSAMAGNQEYEELSANVRSMMSKSIYTATQRRNSFDNLGEAIDWLNTMRTRVDGKWDKRLTNTLHFLQLVHYESKRAGVDPQLVLAIIQVESGFNPFAVSSASARGMMQVMPFWVKIIGEPHHNLFDIETNIRYGCTILRHYIDVEKGNLYRALGRYNGSTGRAEYPNLVMAAYRKNWQFTPPNEMQAGQPAALSITALQPQVQASTP